MTHFKNICYCLDFYFFIFFKYGCEMMFSLYIHIHRSLMLLSISLLSLKNK